MSQIFSFEGITPIVHPSAYVHPSAVLIGDVLIGPGCYVGANAVFRGDFGRIELRDEANFQDNCVAHSLPDFDCIMDTRSQIGHGAVIHGCYIGCGALIGMNSVILDKAKVGEESIVAALAMVKVQADIPARVLVAGTPAKLIRELGEKDLHWSRLNGESYVELARRSLAGLTPATALTHVPEQRPRVPWPSLGFPHLHESKL
jgi:phenylacetic acid degradation protein